MLRSMRHGALSGVFIVILALGTFGLVMADWQGMFSGGVAPTDVAEVGDTVINAQSFDRTLRTTLRSQNLSVQDAYSLGMIDRVLENEISRILLYREAREMGILVSDETVVNDVTKSLQPIMSEGMSRRDALNRVLQSTGMSERGLLETVRRDLSVATLTDTMIKLGVAIPSFLVSDTLQIRKQIRSISAVDFPHSAVTVEPPSESTLKEFYEQIKSRLRPPETRDLALILLDPENLANQIEIDESEMQSYYASNLTSFSVPEKRTVEQAIFNDQDTAQRVLSLFKDKSNMKSAVTKVTGSAEAYLGVEDFSNNGLLEEIAEPVFSANKRDVLGPIQSPLGWHIFSVQKITPEKTKSFAIVKDTINQTLKANLLQDELYTISNDLDDALASGDSLENIKRDFPIQIERQANVSDLGKPPFDILDSDEGRQTLSDVFELYEGESTPVSELNDGRFYTLLIEKITTAPAPELAEVKDKLQKEWIATEGMRQNFKKTESEFNEIKESPETLEKFAQKNGLTVKSATLKEDDTPVFGLTRNSFLQIFSIKQGEALLLPSKDGLLIARLDSIQFPESDLLPAKEIEEQQKLFSDSMKQNLFISYMNALEDKYDVKVNNNLLRKLYGPQEDAL